MKKLIILALAGILTASLPGSYAKAANATFDTCTGKFCFVEINVVDVGGVKTVVANPDIYLVAHRGPEQARKSVTIIFNLTTADYSFVGQKGIEFADKVEFERDSVKSHSKKVVIKDKNSQDVRKHGWHNYTIQVQDKDGNVLNVDPVIINGGGVGN